MWSTWSTASSSCEDSSILPRYTCPKGRPGCESIRAVPSCQKSLADERPQAPWKRLTAEGGSWRVPVSCPQARNRVESFSPATCASEKILLSPLCRKTPQGFFDSLRRPGCKSIRAVRRPCQYAAAICVQMSSPSLSSSASSSLRAIVFIQSTGNGAALRRVCPTETTVPITSVSRAGTRTLSPISSVRPPVLSLPLSSDPYYTCS